MKHSYLEAIVKTIENLISHAVQLYEQEPGKSFYSARLGVYIQHWVKWVRGGLEELAKRYVTKV